MIDWSILIDNGKNKSKNILSKKLSGENNPSFGKKWYTNGKDYIYINPDKVNIPDGFFLGARKVSNEVKENLKIKNLKEKNPSFGKKWYHLDDKECLSKENLCLLGWEKGMLPRDEKTKQKLSKNSLNSHWFNNGLIEVHQKNCPDGFVKGRLPYSESFNIKQHESKKGMKSIIKGKHCYNNGIKNTYFSDDDIIPDGFVKGSCLKRILSEETKKKLSISRTGSHFYNNGIKEISIKNENDIPEGFIKGRLKKE